MTGAEHRHRAVSRRTCDTKQVGGDAQIACMPCADPSRTRVDRTVTESGDPEVESVVPSDIRCRIQVTQPIDDRSAAIEIVLCIGLSLSFGSKLGEFTRSIMPRKPLAEIIVVICARRVLPPVNGVDAGKVKPRRES